MAFIFHNIWDNPSHWLSYFSEGLKPPTSYYIIHYIYTHIHTHWIQVAAEVLGVWLWEVSTTSGSMLVFKYSIWYVETYSHVSDDLFKQECSIYSMMTLYHVYCVYNQVTIYIYIHVYVFIYNNYTILCNCRYEAVKRFIVLLHVNNISAWCCREDDPQWSLSCYQKIGVFTWQMGFWRHMTRVVLRWAMELGKTS